MALMNLNSVLATEALSGTCTAVCKKGFLLKLEKGLGVNLAKRMVSVWRQIVWPFNFIFTGLMMVIWKLEIHSQNSLYQTVVVKQYFYSV